MDNDAHPEIYPRSNGEVYVCGACENECKPPAPGAVVPTPGACDYIYKAAVQVSSRFASVQMDIQQACFLPATSDNIPVLSHVEGVSGAYIAAGHGCWGILMALSSALAMTELIVEGKAECVDLAPFSLNRFSL